ncbi:hypothetical protein DQ04_00211000 [Trypanosoma grayi]|uniref:hypothetical protein n=1 Tax=Trypanosoma grayi TaxID=71804 RepID=UPI0004F42218|nr:hypothetical protein DQ04_00211000 [Trypanosoma grayi]KEG15017.1 hypothetical protein DQ04_00211000 [Trypanosoma grayi]
MPQVSRGPLEMLRQQRLPAWQPLLTPPYVALSFLIAGIIFIPLGGVITVSNQRAKEISFRYDDIQHCTSAQNTGAFTYEGNNMTLKTGCVTVVKFDVTETLKAPVYLYYGLTNFYQNHRRYSNSRSDAQLAGEVVRNLPDAAPLVTPGDITGTSETPITYVNYPTLRYKSFLYVPAGLIAWSMFNDTFTLYKEESTELGDTRRKLICNSTDFSQGENLPLEGSVSPNLCTKKGIAWNTDVAYKFKAPNLEPHHFFWTAGQELYTGVKPSPPLTNDSFFNNGWYANELGHSIPVTTDEDLMVWMRAASLPNFRKLHRVIHTDLVPGKYVMEIGEHYDVSSFGGTKTFALATLSWFGGKSSYLSAMYYAVGGIALFFSAVLMVAYRLGGDRASKALDDILQK